MSGDASSGDFRIPVASAKAENDFLPRNEKINELVATKAYLIEGSQVPESWLAFLDHANSWNMNYITRRAVERTPGITRVFTKVNIHSQKSDFAYWQTQSYQARLAALEDIRQEYHRWRYGA